MKYRMQIKKYVDDSSLTWEERYKRLEAHHIEETKELIERIDELEKWLEDIWGEDTIDGLDWF